MCLELQDWLGLAADLFTFAGGLVLALDAIRAVDHFLAEVGGINTFKALVGKVRLETPDRSPVREENDVHLAALRKVAYRAKIGAGLLIFGYFLQVITRVCEITSKKA